MKLSTSIAAKTITELMDKTTRYMLDRPTSEGVYKVNAFHLFNVSLHAKSCQYELDVRKTLWLYKQRWTKLIRQYIDKESLDRFVHQSQLIFDGKARKGASTNMLFKDPQRYDTIHKWGGCLMGLTFQGELGNHPTITLYSRTCFMGYLALLDAALVYLIILREILTGVSDASVGDVEFRWCITAVQLHTFKILPYLHSQTDLLKELKYGYRHRSSIVTRKNITWQNILRWYCKMRDNYNRHGVEMLELTKYGPWRRIQRRWLEREGHLPMKKPESLYITELDFGGLR